MRLREKRKESGLVLEHLYGYLGISRQGVSKRIWNKRQEDQMMACIRVEVNQYRGSKEVRAGSRNLYFNLGMKEKYNIGVTKFEQLMSCYGLTLKPLHVRIVTTQSCCQSWNYHNLINGLEVDDISQVVAGDLTYIKFGDRVYYLFGLTDLYSARSVGISISDRMRSEDAQIALEEWIDLRNPGTLHSCIHHTDGGGQYFSKTYLSKLTKHHIQISVAKTCLQNGYAEQRNGLIKHHLLPTKVSRDLGDFRKAVQEIIYFYNYERKQEGLGWQTPVEFEGHVKSLRKEDRPKMGLYDFEKAIKGFPRHMSTKS